MADDEMKPLIGFSVPKPEPKATGQMIIHNFDAERVMLAFDVERGQGKTLTRAEFEDYVHAVRKLKGWW